MAGGTCVRVCLTVAEALALRFLQVMDTHEGGPTTVKTLAHIKNIVEGWYQDRGFAFGYISHFDGMDTGHIIANVVEGKVGGRTL